MVSVSVSIEEEQYKKISALKESIEAERMKSISLSSVIASLIKLGFVYREILRADTEKSKQVTLEADII